MDYKKALSVVITLIALVPVMALTSPTSVQAQGRSDLLQVRHSRGCLDVRGGSRRDRAQVQQYICNGRSNQRWQAISVGRGRVTLVNRRSGKCLDVRGGGRRDRARVQQFTCHGGGNQQWYPVQVNNRDFLLVSRNSGQCLDVLGASVRPRALVQQFPCHGGANQRWRFR